MLARTMRVLTERITYKVVNDCIATPVADPGFLKGGFSFSLTNTPAQFELKTQKKKKEKKKVINLQTSLSAVYYIYDFYF